MFQERLNSRQKKAKAFIIEQKNFHSAPSPLTIHRGNAA